MRQERFGSGQRIFVAGVEVDWIGLFEPRHQEEGDRNHHACAERQRQRVAQDLSPTQRGQSLGQ